MSSIFTLASLALLTLGYVAGYHGIIYIGEDMFTATLYMLILLAGMAIGMEVQSIKESGRSILIGSLMALSVILSGIASGLMLSRLFGIDARIASAIGAASGWYSLVGPMVSSIDPIYGVSSFIANILREILHIILYPVLSRCCSTAAVSLGGATTMDTGLPVIALYGRREDPVIALIQGGLITLTAPIILTYILYL
ncbi:MAG: lysine exporter LysO family protein [Desulfurococcales archaeon]|nr:lysine exporter LysO family protein [Desulfurococcales archaeon]